MAEKPNNVSNQSISENDESKDNGDSKNNFTEKSPSKNPSRRFRDFLTAGNLEENGSPNDSPKAKVSSEDFKENNEFEGKENEDKSQTEVHEFHFSQELMKFDIYRKLRSNKERVIKVTGGIIGTIFIIAGILYIMGAAFRVADNVIFGERAVLSAFLILVGVLILAGIFARSQLEGTFLKNIHSELEVAEDPSSDGKSSDKKEKQKSNIYQKDKK
ncbi:MAG: CvpA family protein [Methanobacteriaceae archaeon]|nr:CvpA family protein [Methanobacteriaceae archaeon]